MVELEPHEIDMVYGGDHWGYEGTSEDWMAMAARSYSYGPYGFWGPPAAVCTTNVEYQTRSLTTMTTGGFSCATTGSFPWVSCTLSPTQTSTYTASVTRTTNCTY